MGFKEKQTLSSQMAIRWKMFHKSCLVGKCTKLAADFGLLWKTNPTRPWRKHRTVYTGFLQKKRYLFIYKVKIQISENKYKLPEIRNLRLVSITYYITYILSSCIIDYSFFSFSTMCINSNFQVDFIVGIYSFKR